MEGDKCGVRVEDGCISWRFCPAFLHMVFVLFFVFGTLEERDKVGGGGIIIRRL